MPSLWKFVKFLRKIGRIKIKKKKKRVFWFLFFPKKKYFLTRKKDRINKKIWNIQYKTIQKFPLINLNKDINKIWERWGVKSFLGGS